jgi:hypothetical protein
MEDIVKDKVATQSRMDLKRLYGIINKGSNYNVFRGMKNARITCAYTQEKEAMYIFPFLSRSSLGSVWSTYGQMLRILKPEIELVAYFRVNLRLL